MAQRLPDDIDQILGTLAQIFALRGDLEYVTLLAHSETAIEKIAYSYNGPEQSYTLRMTVPVSLFQRFTEIRDVEQTLLTAMKPLLRSYPFEDLESVVITPRAHPNKNWRDGAMKWLDQQAAGTARSRDGKEYDAFISYASEDKARVAKPMADALTNRGLAIWYDDHRLSVGDSLRQSIDKGLSKSRFGIVVLSRAFFSRQWPQYELDGLVARQVEGKKVILPIWHGVTREDVSKYSPSLADRVALRTETLEIAQLVDGLLEAILSE